jgi:LuxR family maltose regulon positive regulatory protein
MVLRSVVAWKRGSETALPLLREAIYLAEVAADGWLLAHAHPLALEMAREWDSGIIDPKHTRTAKHERAAPSGAGSVPVHNGVLTAKESEILCMLARGMPNKTIALVLDITPGTVKWHMKNIFLKLSASTRRHAVDRARLLGLIQP